LVKGKGGAPTKRKKEANISDYSIKEDDPAIIKSTLSLKVKPFKEFAQQLKTENISKFSALQKYIQQQKNMDRIQHFIVENFCPVNELEDPLK